ncbi:MAG: hypothetical protein ACRD0G_19185 [Acidimicrobiales bacterium]
MLVAGPRAASQEEFAMLVDRALGVSRRKRHVAYAAIGTGLVMLRPMLRRVGAALALFVMLVVVTWMKSVWIS